MVTRLDIIQILKSWENNATTAKEVWDWASERYFPGETEFDDWEGGNSAANEVLCELDSLDMNLVLPEDIPIHIEFLKIPVGKIDEGYRKWRGKIEQIDFKRRCKNLKGHEIYGPFCK
jgi:hypothetical protein